MTPLTEKAIGSLTIGTLAALADITGRAANQLLESHWIGLPAALTVACSVGAFVWWIDGRFENSTKSRDELEQRISERLSRIEQRLEDLPCDSECYDRIKKRKRR